MLLSYCKYISFNPNVPYLNVILTNSKCKTLLSVKLHSHVTIARLEILLFPQRKVFVKHASLIIIDKCKNKQNYQ